MHAAPTPTNAVDVLQLHYSCTLQIDIEIRYIFLHILTFIFQKRERDRGGGGVASHNPTQYAQLYIKKARLSVH